MTLRAAIEPYVGPVSTATFVFPVAASLIAVPFALYHYRRHGRVHPWRAFVSYSFVYYLIAAFFLVILPLPHLPEAGVALSEWDALYGSLRSPRLDPTGFLRDLIVAAPGAGRSRAVSQLVFNVILLLPFGAYLAYGFGRRLPVVCLLGFLLSLSFELCQLTGIFWIYPGPYRLFDAGDLVLNTAGATGGGLLAALLARARILPRLEDLKGPAVAWIGPFRRLVAIFLDISALVGSAILANLALDLLLQGAAGTKAIVASALAMFWFVLLPVIDRGRSLGKRLTFCAIREANGRPAPAPRVLLRQALIWAPPAVAYAGAAVLPKAVTRSIPAVAAFCAWVAFFAVNGLKSAFDAEHAGWLDVRLGTRVRDTWSATRPEKKRKKHARRKKAARERSPRT